VQKVDKQIQEGRLAEAGAELRGRDITHVVQPAGRELMEPGWEMVYGDSHYQVYYLVPAVHQRRHMAR